MPKVIIQVRGKLGLKVRDSFGVLFTWWLNHVESLSVFNPVISCITTISLNGKCNCALVLEYKLVGECLRLLDGFEWGDSSVYSLGVTDLFASCVHIYLTCSGFGDRH